MTTHLIAALIALAVGFSSGWSWRASRADAAEALAQTEAALSKTRAIQAARQDERATTFRLKEAADAEHLQRLAAEAGTRRLDAEHRGLRDELAATRAQLAALDPTAAAGCQAARATASVCTDLLGRCSERRTELARFAESSATAGQLCQRSYDALSPPTSAPPNPTHPEGAEP